MSRIIVTGGAGFIGSHVVDHLLTSGDEVWVIDNFNDYYNPLQKHRNIEVHLKEKKFHLAKIDILDESAMRVVFSEAKPDLVIHLAARVGVRPSLNQVQLYEAVNIRGTVNVLEECKRIKCHEVILASSSSVYGRSPKIPFSEEDDVDHPVSPYAATKRTLELLAYTYHNLWGLSCVCLRFFNVYGERGRPDNIPAMFTQLILSTKPIPKFGDGTTRRDYTYISDIVDGILRCRRKEFGYEIINLGNHHPVSLNDFITTLEGIVGIKAVIEQLPFNPADVPVTYADISKAKRLLDWEPKVSLSEGLRRYVESVGI